MTISSGIDSQINATLASQAKKAAEAPTGEGAGPKTDTEAQPSTQPSAAEAPAVVVDASSQQTQAAAEKLASVEIGSAAEASSVAHTVGSALSQQSSAIANQSTAAVAGLLSELEAA